MSQFSRSYDEAAVISHAVMDGIMDRLQWMIAQPEKIACVGLDGGKLLQLLRSKYQKTELISIHSASEATQLKPQSVDWVLAHFSLPFLMDPSYALREWHGFLKPGGMIFCTHFGPDTLKEWHSRPHVIRPKCMDMHDLGDCLLHTGFIDPVLDVDFYHTLHRNHDHYLRELILTNMVNDKAKKIQLDDTNNEWLTTYEVIFAHAFTNNADHLAEEEEKNVFKIPVSQIKKSVKT